MAPSRYEAVAGPSASPNRYRLAANPPVSASGGTVIGGGRNFDIVESHSAPTGRTVLQPGLLPIRYERLNGAVVSSAYHPAHFAPDPAWGRTYLPHYTSSTVYSSALHQQSPPEKQYRQWKDQKPLTFDTVPPYTNTLSFNQPQVSSLNSTQGHIPGTRDNALLRQAQTQRDKLAGVFGCDNCLLTLLCCALSLSLSPLTGYGGHVKQLQFTYSKSYGPSTAECLERFP